MSLPIVVLLMLFVASAVGMATRKAPIPYTVALVVTGLLLSVVRALFYPEVDIGLHLTKGLLFGVLLPMLVYEAAFHLELRDFLANWKGIFTLAVPGLLIGIFACGAMIHGALGLLGIDAGLGTALLIASIVSATDPVGVISLLRATRAPRRLAVLMEGESLINDGVAVVAFAVAQVALGFGEHAEVTPSWLVRFLSWEVLGAALIGGGIGFFFAWLTSKVDDHLIEITLSTISAFGSFLVAEQVHASGVLACLTAGMLAGNFGAKYGMSPSTRVAVVSFWEYAAFVGNSIIFLLIGLDLHPGQLLKDWPAILATWLAMLVARSVFVAGALPIMTRLEGSMPRGFGAVMVWGGVRGGIAMVLALGIPRSFPHRELAVNCVFGASLLTILLQSTTIGAVLRRLGLAKDRKGFETLERLRARWRSLQAAVGALERQRERGIVSPEAFEVLRAEHEAEAARLEAEAKSAGGSERQLRSEELRAHRRRLIAVRKEALRQAALDGAIDDVVVRRLVGELDNELHALDHAEPETGPDPEAG